MTAGGAGFGDNPCGPAVEFISSTVGEALTLLLRFDVGSLLTPFAKGALVIVASIAECGICSPLLGLMVAVLRVWTVAGADGALLKPGLDCVAVGRVERALCFGGSRTVASSASV